VSQPSLPFTPAGDGPAEIVISCDGGSRGNPGPAAIGAVVVDPSTVPPRRIATISERIGVTTNNVAEYRALIAGLRAAAPLGARRVVVNADSQLVVRQLRGEYRVRQAHLRPLFEEAKELLSAYDDVELRHVPRTRNADADALVNAALDSAPLP
jgi:ribonuclease HI